MRYLGGEISLQVTFGKKDMNEQQDAEGDENE